jgi:hypothetical protein
MTRKEEIMKTRFFLRGVVALNLLLALLPAFGHLGAEECEIPTNAKASDILPADRISGPYYRIKDTVVSYGYMYRYTVDSDFGVFEVTRNGALRKLLREIPAIATLRKVSETEAFTKSLGKSVLKPLKLGESLITNPVDTVTGIPKGVGQLFSNAYTSATGKRNPAEDSQAEQLLALSSYKRQYAYQLGVDVYSSNPVLQKELNRVGWASVVASLSFSAAMMPLGVPGMVVSYSRLGQQINEIVKEEPPAKLRQQNEKRLLEMGISKDTTKRFLDHPNFTPRQDTVIATSLSGLRGAKGREDFIRFILAANDEESANFVMNIAEIMKGYHETVSPIKEIKVTSGLVFARAQNSSVLIPFPVDHFFWTEQADEFVRNSIRTRKASGTPWPAGGVDLWVTGTASPLARKTLEQLGIKVTERVDQKIEFAE